MGETGVTEVEFTCNICGSHCRVGPDRLGRDVVSCVNPSCNSTPRIRAIVQALSEALFGTPMSLLDFPIRSDLRGAGLTDWGYTGVLAERLSYTNTFYDREPRLDITNPPAKLLGALDFLIASDVFEHVPPPVERAFEGAYSLLKPGGAFVLTVPYLWEGETREHFPSLHDWTAEQRNGSVTIVNKTADGRREVFENVHCHGGQGLTVEMRIFSHSDLLRHLEEAGFGEIADWKNRISDPCWTEDHSFPVAARRNG